MRGNPKFGWLKTLKNWPVDAQFHALGQREPFCQVEVAPDEIGTTQCIAAEISELAILRVSPPEQRRCSDQPPIRRRPGSATGLCRVGYTGDRMVRISGTPGTTLANCGPLPCTMPFPLAE